MTARATLTRVDPSSPLLALRPAEFEQLWELAWKAGYRAGAGHHNA